MGSYISLIIILGIMLLWSESCSQKNTERNSHSLPQADASLPQDTNVIPMKNDDKVVVADSPQVIARHMGHTPHEHRYVVALAFEPYECIMTWQHICAPNLASEHWLELGPDELVYQVQKNLQYKLQVTKRSDEIIDFTVSRVPGEHSPGQVFIKKNELVYNGPELALMDGTLRLVDTEQVQRIFLPMNQLLEVKSKLENSFVPNAACPLKSVEAPPLEKGDVCINSGKLYYGPS